MFTGISAVPHHGREGMPLAHWASLPRKSISTAGRPLSSCPAKSSSWYTAKNKKKTHIKMFFFQIIEATVAKTSHLICVTCSVFSTRINWWNILHSQSIKGWGQL